MGGIFSSIFQRLFGNQEVRMVLLGLDAVGKTTIMYRLKIGEVITTIPSIGFNVETVKCKNINFIIWETGGGDKIRPLFRHYYPGAKGIIYVIDSNDRKRLGDAREELMHLLGEDDLREAVLLIFANKQDIPGVMDTVEITEKLGLAEITNRRWHVQASSAYSGQGLYDGLEWLATQLAE